MEKSFLIAFLIVIPIGIYMFWGMSNDTCIIKTYILKGVNGITDEQSGLFSSGDVSRTSLLMNDGTIITINRRIEFLKLNEPIRIRECKLNAGGMDYYIVD